MAATPPTTRMKKKTSVFALTTIVLWASTFVFTKIALVCFTTSSVGVLRYVIASLCFIAIAPKYKIGLPRKKDIPLFLLSGGLGFALYMAAFNRASMTLSAATGSVLIATGPILTALAASILLKETLSPGGWGAIAVSFVGILVLTLWDGVFSLNSGVFWMLIAAVSVSGYNLMQRFFKGRYTALQATAYSIWGGTLLMLPQLPKAAAQLWAAPAYEWGMMLYLGIFPSAIGYLLWSAALSQAEKTSDVTNFMFVTPFLATVLGFALLGEAPTPATFAGGALILAGLWLFQKAGTAKTIKKEAIADEAGTGTDETGTD